MTMSIDNIDNNNIYDQNRVRGDQNLTEPHPCRRHNIEGTYSQEGTYITDEDILDYLKTRTRIPKTGTVPPIWIADTYEDVLKNRLDRIPRYFCHECQCQIVAYCEQQYYTHRLLADQQHNKNHKAKNGRPKGTWELCFTYSPKWYQDDIEAQSALIKAETKLLKYYKDELQLYRSVGEYTKDGRAHLHIIYRLDNGGKFTDKNLTRAYPNWNAKKLVGKGNQGGHHAPVANVADYSGYMEKDIEKSWHVYDITDASDTENPSTTNEI